MVTNMVAASNAASKGSKNIGPALDGDIADNVVSAASLIEAAIRDSKNEIVSAIQSGEGLGEKIFIILIAAVAGALSAFIFNHLHWRLVEKNKGLKSTVRVLISAIKELEDLSVTYWVTDYDSKSVDEWHACEVKIKARMRLIPRYSRRLSEKVGKKYQDNISSLNNFADDIFDLVTGEGFESIARKSSKMKAVKISFSCSDIRTELERIVS